jgi:hypothetical protein
VFWLSPARNLQRGKCDSRRYRADHQFLDGPRTIRVSYALRQHTIALLRPAAVRPAEPKSTVPYVQHTGCTLYCRAYVHVYSFPAVLFAVERTCTAGSSPTHRSSHLHAPPGGSSACTAAAESLRSASLLVGGRRRTLHSHAADGNLRPRPIDGHQPTSRRAPPQIHRSGHSSRTCPPAAGCRVSVR